AATVTAHAAVGVHDDLAAGESGVAHGPADHEASRGIDVIVRVFVEQVSRDHRLDDVLQNPGAQFVVADRLGVLGGDHDRVHALNFAVRIVFDCDLGFAVGAKEGKRPVLAHQGKLLGQL